MSIIAWVVLGLLAGLIAKAIMPGAERIGIILTTLLGIVGAVLGGFLATALGFGDPIDEFFDISTWLAAIVGAIALLVVWGMVTGRDRRVL
jgi:uncharacterized membrane protein YeaQ/YmgE (transglycosylase-associated protein family)